MKTNSNPLELARELGISILNSKELEMYIKAETLLKNNKYSMDLKNLYNIKLKEYNDSLSSNEDSDLLKKELLGLKDKIDSNSFINNYNKTKEDYDKLLKNINNILDYITNNNWKGSKCSCGGCNKG